MKEKLEQYIENINQLGADMRYVEDYDVLRRKLDSIITWCNMANVLVNRLESEERK